MMSLRMIDGFQTWSNILLKSLRSFIQTQKWNIGVWKRKYFSETTHAMHHTQALLNFDVFSTNVKWSFFMIESNIDTDWLFWVCMFVCLIVWLFVCVRVLTNLTWPSWLTDTLYRLVNDVSSDIGFIDGNQCLDSITKHSIIVLLLFHNG